MLDFTATSSRLCFFSVQFILMKIKLKNNDENI